MTDFAIDVFAFRSCDGGFQDSFNEHAGDVGAEFGSAAHVGDWFRDRFRGGNSFRDGFVADWLTGECIARSFREERRRTDRSKRDANRDEFVFRIVQDNRCPDADDGDVHFVARDEASVV